MSVKYFWRTTIALALGCSPTRIEVGSYVGEEGPWDWTDPRACAAPPQLPIVGTWIGYADLPMFASQSNEVRLVISHASGKRICGTLTLGQEAPPWPPVTDPHAAYPPDLVNTQLKAFPSYLARLEGVPRTISGSRVGLPQVLFRASYGQWRDWCAMQTPYLSDDTVTPEYYCIPLSGSGGLTARVKYEEGVGCTTVHGGETHVVDCGKALLCLEACECTATQCAGSPRWGNDYALDFNGDFATGSGLHLRKIRL